MVPYNVYIQKRAGEPQTYAKELQLPGKRATVWTPCGDRKDGRVCNCESEYV